MDKSGRIFFEKGVCAACVGVMFLFAANNQALAIKTKEFQIDNRTDLIYYDVSGPGGSSSIYETGANFLEEVDMRAVHDFENGWDSTFNFNVRLTDYDNFDPESFSVEKFSWKIVSDTLQFDVGDYFANFSQYSMNKSIKGFAAEKQFGAKDNYFRFAYGIFDGQWEYLYERNDNEPMDRHGGGFRYQRQWEKLRLGLNVAHVKDRTGDPIRTTEDAFSQYVPALDWEYRMSGLVVNGESAYSMTQKFDTANNKESTNGSAHKVSLRARMSKLRFDAKIERVSPDFITLGGGATPDRYRFYSKASYKFAKTWDVFGLYDFYRNNLNDRLSSTSRNNSAEVGVKKKKAFGRRSLNISTSYRHKWSEESDDSKDRISDRIKLSISDRIAKIVKIKGDVEAILDDNKITNDSPENYLYSLQLSSRHRFANGDWELRPRFSVSHQERENTSSGGDDITDNLRFDLSARFKNMLNMGVNLEYNDNDLDPSSSVDSIREKALVYCEYKNKWLKGGSIRLEAGYNDYDFTDDSQDYQEAIYKLQFRFSFNKKGGKK